MIHIKRIILGLIRTATALGAMILVGVLLFGPAYATAHFKSLWWLLGYIPLAVFLIYDVGCENE